MGLSDADKLAVAERYFAASSNNDADAFLAAHAPGAVTWHNTNGLEEPSTQTAKVIGWLHANMGDLHWETRAIHPTPTGFVAQNVFTGTGPGGAFRAESCVIITLDDAGLVTRCEEYLDPSQLKAMRG